MAWVKVDDGFPDHPKCLVLSLAAQGLWLVGLCYANRQMTDGQLPAALLRRLGDDTAQQAAEELVAVGLWHETDTGWEIHDYVEYQRSREQIESTSVARAEAGRRGGQARASKLQANAKQVASKNVAESNQKRKEQKRREESTPVGATDVAASPAYRMFQVLCEETGADEGEATRSFKTQQSSIGRQLIADGHDEADVRGCVRYLRSQTWRTGIIDLKTVKSEIGKWAAAGRPVAEPTPIRPLARAAAAGAGYDQFVAGLDQILTGENA